MKPRGKSSVPKTASRPRPSPSTKRSKRPGNGKPRTANKDTSLLLDKRAVREDVALIKTAVTGRWPVNEEKLPTIFRRLVGIVEKTTVTIATKTGPVEVDAIADENAINASRVIVAMMTHNQRDDFRGEPDTVVNNVQHISINNTTNVAEQPIDPAAVERRTRLLELATAWRARGLVIDGVTVEQDAASGVDRELSHSPSVPAGTGN